MKDIFRRAVALGDPEGYAMWALRHRYCHACGIPYYSTQGRRWPISLTTHHIIKCHRSDEPCNLLRLCGYCHELAENRIVTHEGEILPYLGLAICLTVKKFTDPDSWNPERLAELYHRPLPDLEDIPDWFCGQWLLWMGKRKRGQ